MTVEERIEILLLQMIGYEASKMSVNETLKAFQGFRVDAIRIMKQIKEAQ